MSDVLFCSEQRNTVVRAALGCRQTNKVASCKGLIKKYGRMQNIYEESFDLIMCIRLIFYMQVAKDTTYIVISSARFHNH